MATDNSEVIELIGGVYLIDTTMIRPGLAACYLLVRDGRVAIVETGTRHSVPAILSALEQLNFSRDQVDYVIPTHVHLDHAGGVGLLMQELAAAQLVIHPRGARHMIDPSRLQAGSTAVYGEALYQELYGDLIAVPQERIIIADDQFELLLGQQTLVFYDTPGHADHHFCVFDSHSQSFFTGDTFGIAYQELVVDAKPFIFPTTTPVQFNPQALKASIARMMAQQPVQMFLTHYGMVKNPQDLAPQLEQQINDYVAICDAVDGHFEPGAARVAQLQQRLTDYTLKRASAHGCDAALAAQTIAFDMGLNAQGLEVWLTRR